MTVQDRCILEQALRVTEDDTFTSEFGLQYTRIEEPSASRVTISLSVQASHRLLPVALRNGATYSKLGEKPKIWSLAQNLCGRSLSHGQALLTDPRSIT